MQSFGLPRLAVGGILCFACYGQSSKLPSELAFLSKFGQVRDSYPYEDWSKATFPRYGVNQVDKMGHHWRLWIEVPGSNDRVVTWSKVKPVVLEGGWTVVSENTGGGFLAVVHYQQNGVETWANAVVNNSYNPVHVDWDVIEVVPPPISLTLVAPAATPEKMPTGFRGDFPFLSPFPNSVARDGQEFNVPFRIRPKGSNQEEIVADGSIERGYSYKNLSALLFGTVYHDALTKAGWDVDQAALDSGTTTAHYSKNGRNLWAYLAYRGGDNYEVTVGKEGAPELLKRSLTADCHVALYGVLFDFNKSTLQPASDGPLQQVAVLMAANPALKVEVQGHTDNVGGDAYNQTLSEARAGAVMKWLSDHGVAAARMTAKGYGKTMPVADNNTDEGRMKNRRVEIADPSCKQH